MNLTANLPVNLTLNLKELMLSHWEHVAPFYEIQSEKTVQVAKVLQGLPGVERGAEALLDRDNLTSLGSEPKTQELAQWLEQNTEKISSWDMTETPQPPTREEWIDEIVKTPSLRLLAVLMDHFSWLTQSERISYLLRFFLLRPYTDLTFEDLQPLLAPLGKHWQRLNQTLATIHIKRRHLGQDPDHPSLALAELLALVAKLHNEGTLRPARPLGQMLTPFLDATDMVWEELFIQAGRLTKDRTQLLAYLTAVAQVQKRAMDTSGTRLLQADFFLMEYCEADAAIRLKDSSLQPLMDTDIQIILERGDHFGAGKYCQAMPKVIENDSVSDFSILVRWLSTISTPLLHDGIRAVETFLQAGIPLADVVATLKPFRERKPAEIPNALFQPIIKADPPHTVHDLFPEIWQTALTLIPIQPFLAQCWLKATATLFTRFGLDYPKQIAHWCQELNQEFAAGMVALFMHYLSLASNEGEPLDEVWFQRVKRFSTLSPSNIDWIQSDLSLRMGGSDGKQQAERWAMICEVLHEKHPHSPHACLWQLQKLQQEEAHQHIDLWQQIARLDNNPSFLPTLEKQQSVTVLEKHLRPTNTPKGWGERLVWEHIAHLVTDDPKKSWKPDTSPEVNRFAHFNPILDRLDDPLLVPKWQEIGNMSCRNISTVLGTSDLKKNLNMHECLNLVHQVPKQDQYAWRELRKMLFGHLQKKEGFWRPVLDLLQEIEAFDSWSHPFEEVRVMVGVAFNRLTLPIMPDAQYTGCCTDGPNGEKRSASLIHALHQEAFKLLVCMPHPKQAWQRPMPFVSVAGFRVTCCKKAYLLVDSMDAGPLILTIDNGIQVISRTIIEQLMKVASETGLPLLLARNFSRHATKTLGKEILHTIIDDNETVLDSIDLQIKCADLKNRGIEQFYCEQAYPTYWVNTNDTGHLYGVDVVRFIPSRKS